MSRPQKHVCTESVVLKELDAKKQHIVNKYEELQRTPCFKSLCILFNNLLVDSTEKTINPYPANLFKTAYVDNLSTSTLVLSLS